jgi:hypothetical protein
VRRLRNRPFLVACLSLVAGCGSSAPSTDGRTAADSTELSASASAETVAAVGSKEATTTLGETTVAGSKPEVDRPATLAPGTSSVAILTKAEICSLVPDDEAKAIWKFSTDVTGTGWAQDSEGTTCSQIFNDEATTAATSNVVWAIVRKTKADWPTADTEAKRSIKDATIGGLPALIVSTEKSDLSDKDVKIFVEIDPTFTLQTSLVGGEAVMNAAKLTIQTERIVGRLSSLKPTVEPSRDTPATNVFSLTGGQLCGLLRTETAAALLVDSYESGTSDYLLGEDSSSCSIGGAKLGLDIRSTQPFTVVEEAATETNVNGVDAILDRPSLEGGKPTPGGDVQYVALSLKWRDVWLEVQARSVKSTPEVEKLVLDEMKHVIAQLDKMIPA